LIIDDDPVFALLASETLQQGGFDARVASNTVEALASFERDRPDLVLLDVDLPGSNGFEICTRLRATKGGGDVPIVMVTGHDDTESIAQAFEVGATDFIHKPVLWPTLPHRIGFMLRALDNMRALKLSEQKTRALLLALPDPLFIVGRDGVLLDHITGHEGSKGISLVGKELEEVFPADVARAARAAISGVKAGELTTYEFEVGHGKEKRCFEARLRPQADGPLLIVTRDTTERRRAKARIEYLAYYDTLTNLPNRQLFVREAERAIRSAEQQGGGTVVRGSGSLQAHQ
jgi:PleD family two-component response regulator